MMQYKTYDNGVQMNEENCSFTYETSDSRTIKITNTISALSLEGNRYITELRFPENNNIQVFFDYTFKDNINLKKLDLRNTKISRFGTGTFQGCSLEELNLPSTFINLDGVDELWGMKENQNSLTSIEIEENNSIYSFDNAIYDKKEKSLEFASRTTTELWNEVKIIKGNVFANLDTDYLVIPESVNSIQSDAFSGLDIDKIIFQQNFNHFENDCFSKCNVKNIQFTGRTKKEIIADITGIENSGIKEGTTIVCGDQQTFQFGRIYLIKDDNTGITNKLMLNDHVYGGFPENGEISSVVEKFSDNIPKKYEVYNIENGTFTRTTEINEPEYEVLVEYNKQIIEEKWNSPSFGESSTIFNYDSTIQRDYQSKFLDIKKEYSAQIGSDTVFLRLCKKLFLNEYFYALNWSTKVIDPIMIDIYDDPDSYLELNFNFAGKTYKFNRNTHTQTTQEYIKIHNGMNVSGIIADGAHSFTDKSEKTIYVTVENHKITYLSDKEPEYDAMTPASPDEVFVVTMASKSYDNSLTNIEYDADSIENIFKPYSNHILKFKNNNVTVKNLEDSVRSAINDPKCKLLVFHFSDHGGCSYNNYMLSNGSIIPNESKTDQNYDQFMLMGDKSQTHYSDKKFWNLIKNAKCRILCIFACCHAGSMFIGKDQNKQDTTIPALLSFGACKSNEVSWYSNNGKSTESGHRLILSIKQILKSNSNITYQQLWNKASTTQIATSNDEREDKKIKNKTWYSVGPHPTIAKVGDQEKITQFLNMKIFT